MIYMAIFLYGHLKLWLFFFEVTCGLQNSEKESCVSYQSSYATAPKPISGKKGQSKKSFKHNLIIIVFLLCRWLCVVCVLICIVFWFFVG